MMDTLRVSGHEDDKTMTAEQHPKDNTGRWGTWIGPSKKLALGAGKKMEAA